MAFFLAPAIVFIALNMLEVALTRRRAFLSMYLRQEGRLFRLLKGGIAMLTWQIIKALVLGTVLLVESIHWQWWIWLVLLADIALVGASYPWLSRQLATELKPSYAAIFARRWLVLANTITVILVIAIIGLYMPQTDYRTLSWLEAIHHKVVQVQAHCDVLAVLARLTAAKNALAWWSAESWLTGLESFSMALLGWLVFLLSSVAFAWAYTRLLLGILAPPLHLLSELYASPSES